MEEEEGLAEIIQEDRRMNISITVKMLQLSFLLKLPKLFWEVLPLAVGLKTRARVGSLIQLDFGVQ